MGVYVHRHPHACFRMNVCDMHGWGGTNGGVSKCKGDACVPPLLLPVSGAGTGSTHTQAKWVCGNTPSGGM